MKYEGPGILIDKPGKDYGPLWEDRYPLAFVFHSTETRGLPGYREMTINPHLTIDPDTERVWPHVDLDLRVGALRGSNTLYNETGIRSVTNEKAVQIELICYSSKSTADRVGGLWVGKWTDAHYEFVAQVVAWIKAAKGIGDTVTPVPAGGWKYGSAAATRGDHLAFEQLDGACAHGFVWGQNHWDTGVLDIERIWTRAAELNQPPPPPPVIPNPGGNMDAATLTANTEPDEIRRLSAAGLFDGDPEWWIARLDQPENPEWQRFWTAVYINSLTR